MGEQEMVKKYIPLTIVFSAALLTGTFSCARLIQEAKPSEEGQTKAAIEGIDRSEKDKVEKAELHVRRGIGFAEKGQFDMAIADFDKAINIYPTFADAYNNRGIAYGKKGKLELAVGDFSRTIEISPS